jgi:hypothetical protein
MSESTPSNRTDLQRLARRAMVDAGFVPEFGAPALAEVAAIRAPAATQIPSVRDMRGLLWASFDVEVTDGSTSVGNRRAGRAGDTPGATKYGYGFVGLNQHKGSVTHSAARVVIGAIRNCFAQLKDSPRYVRWHNTLIVPGSSNETLQRGGTPYGLVHNWKYDVPGKFSR